jgi:hypothetical protein
MTTTTDPGAGYAPTPGPTTPGCDPDQFARLKCVAEGIAARAKYNADTLDALTTAQTRYDAARGLYTKARDDAAPLLAQARKDLDKAIERLDCLLDDDVKQQLGAAAEEVGQQLRATGWGCYLCTDCDFDDDVRNCPPSDVPSRIADIQRRTKEAEDFYAVRIEEPTRIGERVTKLQADIADLAAKVGNDPAPADLPKLYAAALVANLHYDMVWDGFDSVDDYMDCLCTALNCIFGGHNAISRLTQKQAVAVCWAKRKADAEKKLEDDPAQAVLDLYTHPEEQGDGYGTQAPPPDYPQPPTRYPSQTPPQSGYTQQPPADPSDDGCEDPETDDGDQYDETDDDAGYGDTSSPQSGGYGQGQPPPQTGGYAPAQPPQTGGYSQVPADPSATTPPQTRPAGRTSRRTPPRQATTGTEAQPANRTSPTVSRRRTQNPSSGQ